MQTEEPGIKSKVIIAIVILAAVAIIYVISMGHSQGAWANSSASDTPLASSSRQTASSPPSTSTSPSGMTYKAGTYSASGSYRTPESFETINVSLTVAADGTVTDSSVQQSASNRESEQYQTAFRNNYKQYVVGKKLTDINIQFVSGSSLTANGFQEALSQIESQAGQS